MPASGNSRRTTVCIVTLIAAAVYWRTAYPTITWWDSSGYSLVAHTLGVASPPGSLVLTLLGWPFSHLPAQSPAHTLNLLAGVIGAIAIALTFVVALAIRSTTAPAEPATPSFDAPVLIAAAAGALAFAFTDTVWEHAIKFTPYILTAAVTGVILTILVRWWNVADEPNGWRWIALLALVFGLDFSVHRTNALLMPSAVAWILIRRPRTLGEARVWIASIVAMALGLSVQLLIMPIAAFTSSPWRSDLPDTWTRFWRYVSVARMGGGFLVQFVPRKSPLWSAQFADFFHVFRENFVDGTMLGALPLILGVVGLATMWRQRPRFGLAFTVLLVLHAITTVMYFNIPPDFFRPFDRHYLPVALVFAVAMTCGAAALVDAARQAAPRAAWAPWAMASLIVVVPLTRLVANWHEHDAAGRYFARDYASNALKDLPPNAIYFTVGDNGTYPVLYLQSAEGVRRDVTVINIGMLNMYDYVTDLRRRDPGFPITRLPPLAKDLHEDVSDAMLLDIARANAGRRPLAFSTTVGGAMGSLTPRGQLQGTYMLVMPGAAPPLDVAVLRRAIDGFQLRGYERPLVVADQPTLAMGNLYREAMVALLDAESSSDRCRGDAAAFMARIAGLDRYLESDPLIVHCARR